jgi:hypothetical protein
MSRSIAQEKHVRIMELSQTVYDCGKASSKGVNMYTEN